MQITQSLPIQGLYPVPQTDMIVDQLHALWNNWWDHPSEETARALLSFLNNPAVASHLRDLAKAFPGPDRPEVNFAESLDLARQALAKWIKDGCDPDLAVIPSEFVADIAKWVDYVNQY